MPSLDGITIVPVMATAGDRAAGTFTVAHGRAGCARLTCRPNRTTKEGTRSTVRLFFPVPAYEEVTPLTAWPRVPSTYVLGTRDRIINKVWARSTVPIRLGVEPTEIATGHCPQNSRPEPVAELLARVAHAA